MIQLRIYQQEAVKAVYQHLRERDDNPCVVAPTGVGKSVIIAKIASDAVSLWNGRVLVLAHVKELLQQNAEKIQTLCPDLDVGIYSAGLNRRDTDNAVIVAGIQSVYKRACELGAFDLVIIDEAHLLSPDSESMYQQFLIDAQVVNPNLRVIGLTATPYRLKGGVICQPENILNHVCYEAGLKEMIVQGYLCKLKSRGGRAKADLDNLHIRGGEFIASEMEAAMDQDSLVRNACREIVELTRNRKSVLIFTTSVEHCQNVAAEIIKVSDQECGIVTGNTPAGQRAEVLARFKGETVPSDLFGGEKPPLKYLANVNVLTTGFDATNVDCVVLLRPTASVGLYVQMVGRGTRLHPGKEDCIAEGQRVLTDSGLIPIENLTTSMKVWDGVEFVSHSGAICKGEQNVIQYAGLIATPEHKVWTQKGWATFRECAAKQTPICVTGVEGKKIREADGCFRRNFQKRQAKPPLLINSLPRLRERRIEKLRQFYAWYCRMQKMRKSATSTEMVGQSIVKCKRQMLKSEQYTIPRLWRARHTILFQIAHKNGCVGTRESWVASRDGNRPDRQRRELRARKLKILASEAKQNEYLPKTYNCYAPCFSYSFPGCQICGFNNSPDVFPRDDIGRNSTAIPQKINQTKRRVWDILNAGPRNRFTVEGLLVSNCLVLDYGGNVLRHGPVDAVAVATGEKGGKGQAPAKECPKCNALIHAAYQVCPECGYAFPESQANDKLSDRADSSAILSGEITDNEYEVREVFYSVHTKRGADDSAPKTMRIEYRIGWNVYQSEWVCPEHTGYARKKFEKWWTQRSNAPVPQTAQEAVDLAHDGALAEIKLITVRSVSGEKFDRVIGYEIGDKPDYAPEPGWNDGDDMASEDSDLVLAGAEWDEEEVPF